MSDAANVVAIEDGSVVVKGASALDGEAFEDKISLLDVVQIVLERGEPNGCAHLRHWFLGHRDGWTLHFNDQFVGASAVISHLERFGSFVAPSCNQVARPGADGTVVWRTG